MSAAAGGRCRAALRPCLRFGSWVVIGSNAWHGKPTSGGAARARVRSSARVKAYSGRSLREWQSLVKTEGVFFAARERHQAGQPFDWAGLAQDEGFADQAHLSRASKRITGFPPSEFAQRFIEDESFWLYRLWV